VFFSFLFGGSQRSALSTCHRTWTRWRRWASGFVPLALARSPSIGPVPSRGCPGMVRLPGYSATGSLPGGFCVAVLWFGFLLLAFFLSLICHCKWVPFCCGATQRILYGGRWWLHFGEHSSGFTPGLGSA